VQQPPEPETAPWTRKEAFAARCLLRAARSATLATQSDGQPYASLVTPAVLPDGAVLILISALALHTRHLEREPRCALMVTGEATDPVNPQTAPRLTLMGRAERLDDPPLRRFWVSRHPYAFYADFTDFGLWRLMPESGHFVAGFGRAHLIPARHLVPPDAATATLEAAAPALRDDLRGTHRPAFDRLMASRGFTGAADVLGIDVDGLDVIQDEKMLRIPFDAPAKSAEEAMAAFLRLTDAAP
jgi:putative heme iron utilization protein